MSLHTCPAGGLQLPQTLAPATLARRRSPVIAIMLSNGFNVFRHLGHFRPLRQNLVILLRDKLSPK